METNREPLVAAGKMQDDALTLSALGIVAFVVADVTMRDWGTGWRLCGWAQSR